MIMQSLSWLKNQSIELYLGVITWFVVIAIAFALWQGGDHDIRPVVTPFNIVFSISLFLLYITGLLVSYGRFGYRLSRRKRILGVVLSGLSALMLSLFFYFAVVGILVTIVVVQLPNYFRLKDIWFIAIFFPLLAVSLDTGLKDSEFYYNNLLLYIMFNVLAMITCDRYNAEHKAKKKSQQLVRELSATQILLSAVTKREERMRIARDLHDVLGHQLTALNLHRGG